MIVVAGRSVCCGCCCRLLCRPPSLCPWGGPWLASGWWRKGGGVGCKGEHKRWCTLAPHCPSIICGWPISALSCKKMRRREGYRANHRLTEVPWWVELGVWLPNGVTLYTLTKQTHTYFVSFFFGWCLIFLTHPLTTVGCVHAGVCATVHMKYVEDSQSIRKILSMCLYCVLSFTWIPILDIFLGL